MVRVDVHSDWITMKTQEEEDEISSNDVMTHLRTDMLSQFAPGQVVSIFIRV